MVRPVFVCDAQGTPLMPIAAAYARKLLRQGKATWQPHHAFSVIRLTRIVTQRQLRSIIVGIDVHFDSAQLLIVVDAVSAPITLLSITIDLRTDLVWRLRRRKGHRQRRRARSRYRASKHYGIPFKRRRPNMLRSRWRHQHPRRTHISVSKRFSAAIMRWRAQAIRRTIVALQRLLPISHAVLLNTTKLPLPVSHHTTLRQRLIATYGVIVNGHPQPICAYCGTTSGSFEIDHVLPRSRGGTDAWNNVVLACVRCNDRKGNRTPQEAGMTVHYSRKRQTGNRIGVYQRATETALLRELHQIRLPTHQNGFVEENQTLMHHVAKVHDSHSLNVPQYLAKPITRGAKQRYSARNYAYTTLLKPGWERLATAVKQRTRVNSLLYLKRVGSKNIATVVRVGDAPQQQDGMKIRIGMLCEAKRAGQLVVGIVTAIESSGRLRFLVPQAVESERVLWKRILIAPRQHLRVLASESVIFFATPINSQGGA